MTAKAELAAVGAGVWLGMLALLFGVLWAIVLETSHEKLHGSLARSIPSHAAHSHEHSAHDHDEQVQEASEHLHAGSLEDEAMERLLRGHIHFMGVGLLAVVLSLVMAQAPVSVGWKKAVAWAAGLGAVLYPPSWILMGLRTPALGAEAAEESVAWLFVPAVGLLLASLLAALFFGWRMFSAKTRGDA